MFKNTCDLKKLLLFGVAFFFCSNQLLFSQNQRPREKLSFVAYKQLKIPNFFDSADQLKPKKIRVAIIDDGFNTNHVLIKPFLNKLSLDKPNNYIDDDANGYVDDNLGYDVADNDNNIGVPHGRERDFYHGTMVASIISTVFIECYDSLAPNFLEFVLIKAVSDKETKPYITHGYDGIKYAINQNVDFICCAWSGAELNYNHEIILNEANRKGIKIIASSGNHFKKVLPPASYPTVTAVSAIDSSGVIIPNSNLGMEIDYVAMGNTVRAGHPLAPNAYFYGSGSSAATALVCGSLANLKSLSGKNTSELLRAMTYTAKPVDSFNPKFWGRVGSGIPHISNALSLLLFDKNKKNSFNPNKSKGIMLFDKKSRDQTYMVSIPKTIHGIKFKVNINPKDQPRLSLRANSTDSSHNLNASTSNLSTYHFVSGNRLSITNDFNNKFPFTINYQVSCLDSSKLYCKGIKTLTFPMDNLGDGSNANNYTSECDCKWIIRAPEGKKIQLNFTKMDTQGNRDFVWIFEGDKTHEDFLLAKFSGHNKPPVIVSQTNVVMLWFLSDSSINYDGWTVSYNWVD